MLICFHHINIHFTSLGLLITFMNYMPYNFSCFTMSGFTIFIWGSILKTKFNYLTYIKLKARININISSKRNNK